MVELSEPAVSVTSRDITRSDVSQHGVRLCIRVIRSDHYKQIVCQQSKIACDRTTIRCRYLFPIQLFVIPPLPVRGIAMQGNAFPESFLNSTSRK